MLIYEALSVVSLFFAYIWVITSELVNEIYFIVISKKLNNFWNNCIIRIVMRPDMYIDDRSIVTFPCRYLSFNMHMIIVFVLSMEISFSLTISVLNAHDSSQFDMC